MKGINESDILAFSLTPVSCIIPGDDIDGGIFVLWNFDDVENKAGSRTDLVLFV